MARAVKRASPTPGPLPREKTPFGRNKYVEGLRRRQVSISINLGGPTTTADSSGSGSSNAGSSGGSSQGSGGSTGGSGTSGGSGGTTGGSGATTADNSGGSGGSGTTNNGGSSNGGSGGNTSQGSSGSTASGNSGSGGTTSADGVATATVVTSAAPVQTITSSSTNAEGQVVSVVVTQSANVVTLTSQKPGATGAAANGDLSGSSTSNGGVIGGVVGGVVGGLALLVLLAFLTILWRRRSRRTGHGWFLCFGRRPSRKDDLDVDWPTFDPTIGAAGVGGTLGSAASNGGDHRRNGRQHGTLPNVDAGDDDEFGAGAPSTVGRYSRDEMRDVGSGPYAPSTVGYYSQNGGPTSDGYHYGSAEDNNGYGNQAGQASAWGMAGYPAQPRRSMSTAAPDYGHLDPPEVREQRAREQAEAQAQAMGAHGTHSSPPQSPRQQRNDSLHNSYMAHGSPPNASPPPQTSGSPPPFSQQRQASFSNSGAPSSDRPPSGIGGLFTNSFWNDGAQSTHQIQQPHQDDDAGTVVDGDYQGGARRLHLLNP